MKRNIKLAMIVVIIVLLAVIVGAFVIFSDDENENSQKGSENSTSDTNQTGSEDTASDTTQDTQTVIEPADEMEETESYKWDESVRTTTIAFGNAENPSQATVEGDGVKISGNDIIILDGGQYDISGTLAEGRILIDAKDEEVYIRLSGADITCSYSSAIYAYKAAKLTIVLAEGTVNSITDGTTYDYSDDYSAEADLVPNACLYSKSDLLICGTGELTVNGNCEQGISGKDALYIADAKLDIWAKGKAILGKDKIVADSSEINAESEDDTIHSNGNIFLTAGSYTLASGDDGIHADAAIMCRNAAIYVEESNEGIEGWQITLTGCDVTIYSDDDAINATNGASDEWDFGGNQFFDNGMGGKDPMQGGKFQQGGMEGNMTPPGGADGEMILPDGMDGDMTPPGGADGEMTLPDGKEGIMMPQDGQNAADSVRNQTTITESDYEIFVRLENSNIFIDCGGDGLDSNGNLYMDGGSVIIYGPANSGNGGLDYASGFEFKSGTLLVMDMSGMAMIPSSCAVTGVNVTLTQNLSAGDIVCVQSEDYLYCFEAAKNYNHFTLITPDMNEGDVVTVLSGGTYSEAFESVLENGGTYSGGSEIATLTLESGITSYGSSGMNGGMNGGMHGGMHDGMRGNMNSDIDSSLYEDTRTGEEL
ncbi:MAG: carbohydrate-binding domain-containing protein [Lachnospiraceae bacterium]